MPGILKLAYKLLVNDKSKFTALLVGVSFAVFLMMFITSMAAGVLNHSSANVINIGAPLWVMDPTVQTPSNSVGMPDYVLDAVRSMPGVGFAVPLYLGSALVRLPDGTYQAATVIGLDDTSLYGRPALLQGNIADIYAENGFIAVRDADYPKLESPRIGSEFELNDHRAVTVGIARVSVSSVFGLPTLYTTYERAVQYLPNPRYTISYVLVQPKTPGDIAGIQRQVAALGYVALTRDQFISRATNFYMFHTGLGMNLMIMAAIAFIVGLSISGQTFFTFVLENIDRFGALKAIGSKGRELIAMIFFQAAFTTLTGYGLGVGVCTAIIAVARMRLPEYSAIVTFANIGAALGMVLVIAGVSSYFGIRRVLRIEPFDIFRG